MKFLIKNKKRHKNVETILNIFILYFKFKIKLGKGLIRKEYYFENNYTSL